MKPKHLKPEMALAVLEGRKKQTRMPVPGLDGEWIYSGPNCNGDHLFVAADWQKRDIKISDCTVIRKAKYKIGDVLYIRERARLIGGGDSASERLFKYESDGSISDPVVIPSRIKHMITGQCCSNGCFRELARTFVKITGVRVEKIQDIHDFDIQAEGIKGISMGHRKERFKELWESIYPGSWDRNDWVFVYDFEKCEKP
jgi:hypothetical protein